MPPTKDVHVPIPGTCECISLGGKGGIRVASGIEVAYQLTLKLDYLGRPNVVTRVLKCGRGRQKRRSSNAK